MMADYLENGGNASARLPSYMALSRAISGYAEYNKYCPELKRDPPKPSYSHRQQTSTTKLQPNDRVDNFYSLPHDINNKLVVNNNDEDAGSKTFLQKKIESLYGESFAEDWLKSKPKAKAIKSNRSPSCPPNKLEGVKTNPVLLAKTHQISLDETNRTKTPEPRPNEENANTFLVKLAEEKTKIRNKISEWETLLNGSNANIPEDVVGYIRATIGKANLLLDKKFQQFEELCHNSLVSCTTHNTNKIILTIHSPQRLKPAMKNLK